ncbi:MAG: hypothetical protein LUM44_20175 [Pyrinomonadaceae bacterium]|nr:hypothetical protein [Pyrinomonadaceae bacterium]
MEEFIEPGGETVPAKETENITEKPKEPKKTWRQYFETDDAVRLVYLIFGLFAIILVMTLLQFQTKAICCGDWDGYYHIRWSQLLWQNFSQGKWLPTFEWLPLTVLNPQDYADHHFLFHLLQIPFLWFFEPVMAAKVAAVTYASLAIFSVYWILYRYKVEYQLLWLIAILVCANSFYYRMNMAKAPPLTIIITIVGIYLLFERRYVWLAPLMFAFVWTYSLFPLLLFAAVFWTIIIAWNERRFEWRPLAYTGGGMILGNLINPYFPQNLLLFWEHFYTKFKVGSDFAVAVGGEWYPYTGMELILNFPVALLAMLVGYILFMPKNGKLPERATFFLMFVTVLLAAQFRSKRFAEYFPPFAILFVAFSWQAFKTREVIELPDEFKRDIEPFLDVDQPTEKQQTWNIVRQAGVWTLGIALFIFFVYNLAGFHHFGVDESGLMETIKGNEADDRYQRAMNWATGKDEKGIDNIPAGERIFNCNWDDFPKLFFFNTKHSYVFGLDPNYLFSENPDLYKQLVDITAGKVDDSAPVIREKFGANYIFADAKENEEMIAKALESGWVEIVYEDDEARILKIRPQKGEAPKEAIEDDAPPTPEELKQLEEEERAENTKKANANVEEESEP